VLAVYADADVAALGQIERVSIPNTADQALLGIESLGLSRASSLRANGAVVTFDSDAPNLVPDDTNNTGDIFVRNLRSGVTRRVSISSEGLEGNALSLRPAISANGRLVTFTSMVVLEGAPEALDTALGLGRPSADPGDAELIEDTPDLGRQRFAGELFRECERFLRPGLKDHVAVAVKRERDAALAHHLAQEQEVTLGVLLFAKESVGNVACGVIDRSDESKPGPVWTQPLVAAAIDL